MIVSTRRIANKQAVFWFAGCDLVPRKGMPLLTRLVSSYSFVFSVAMAIMLEQFVENLTESDLMSA